MPKGIFQPSFNFLIAANSGALRGASTDFQVGYNTNVGITEETLWTRGGRYVWPERTGEAMEVVSDSAADVGIPVVIQGLDGTGLAITDVVVLNGTTPVPTNLIFGRINFFINVGPTEFVGTVVVQEDGGGNVYAEMLPENQQSFQLIYTIPSNKNGFFLPAESSTNRSQGTDTHVFLSTRVTRPGGVSWRASRWGLQQNGTSAFIFETADTPLLTPWADIEITCTADVAGVDVSGRLPIVLLNP